VLGPPSAVVGGRPALDDGAPELVDHAVTGGRTQGYIQGSPGRGAIRLHAGRREPQVTVFAGDDHETEVFVGDPRQRRASARAVGPGRLEPVLRRPRQPPPRDPVDLWVLGP